MDAEPKRINDMDSLRPDFREKVILVLSDMNAWCAKHEPEYHFVVLETFRTKERQKWLYAQGRKRQGKIVTNLTHSRHQDRLACDCAPMFRGDIAWDAPKNVWDYYGHCVRAHGLRWGGDWKSIHDSPHMEV